MSTDVTKLMRLVAERDAHKKEAGKAIDAAAKLTEKIKSICPHAMTVERESWFEDEWSRTTYTTSWDECTVCGKQLNVKKDSKSRPGV